MQLELADSPAVAALNEIFRQAVDAWAEEIVFGMTDEAGLGVEMRVEGELRPIAVPGDGLGPAIFERFAGTLAALRRADTGDAWVRLPFAPPWTERYLFYSLPRAPHEKVRFTEYQIGQVPDPSERPYRVSLHNPVLEAQQAYLRRDYAAAFRVLDALETRAHPDALVLLAELCEKGLGTDPDPERAGTLRRLAEYPPSQWCLVGNIVAGHAAGPGGTEWVEGTRHFKPGAKVYCLPPQWGDGYENIKVVGRHRHTNRYVTMVIRSVWVTNWRAKVVHSPTVLHRLNWAGSMWSSEILIRYWVDVLRARA